MSTTSLSSSSCVLVAALAGVLSACGESEDAIAIPSALVVRFGTDVSLPIAVPRNSTVALDVYVETPEGMRPEKFDLRVEHYGDDDDLVTSVRVGPGHARVNITIPTGNAITYFNASVCPREEYMYCDGGVRLRSRPVRFTSYGGHPAAEIYDAGDFDLTVGEKRPLRFVGMVAEGPHRPYPVAAHEPPTFEVSDGSILASDERGIFEGLSPGTVDLTVNVAEVSKTYRVTVHDPATRPMRRLENEVVRLGGLRTTSSNSLVSVPRGSKFEAITTDGEGHPILLVEQSISVVVDHKQYLLLRWTGTGWGVEAPFPPSMTVLFPVMVKDDDGVLYLGGAHVEHGTFFIATRDVDDIGGAFEFRALPWPSFADADDPLSSVGPLHVRRGGGYDPESVSPTSDWITLLPRASGGVRFGYTPSFDIHEGDCARTLIAGSLSDDALTHETRETFEWMRDATGSCTWMVPTGEIHWHAGRAPDDEPMLSNARSFNGTRSEAWRSRELDGLPAPGIEIDRVESELLEGMMRFDDGDRVHTLGPHSTTMQWMDPYGATVLDYPQERLFATRAEDFLIDSEGYVSALGHHGSTSFAVFERADNGNPFFAAWTPPPMPPLDGAESTTDGLAGLRIERTANPEPVSGLVVLPNGKRVVLQERLVFLEPRFTAPAIARSAGPNERWLAIKERDLHTFELAGGLHLEGTVLYGTGRRFEGDSDVHFYTSDDEGLTWQSRGLGLDGEHFATASRLFAGGRREVTSAGRLSRQMYLHRANGADAPFVQTEWLPPDTYRWNESTVAYVSASGAGVAPTVEGRVLRLSVATRIEGGAWAYALVVDELDADGVDLGQRIVPVPAGLRIRNTVRLADGDLVLFGGDDGEHENLATVSVRIDWETGMVQTSPLPAGRYKARHPFLRLPDGRLLAPIEDYAPEAPNFRIVAAYLTSTDGLTWSEPVALRPDGGRGQVVYAAALDGDEHVLFAIGDGGALSRDISWGTAYQVMGEVNAFTPRMVPMSVRVSL